MKRFNLKKLKEIGGEKHYRVEVPNIFIALENLDAELEIKNAWEAIEKIPESQQKNV
jgi:hypothetical protein